MTVAVLGTSLVLVAIALIIVSMGYARSSSPAAPPDTAPFAALVEAGTERVDRLVRDELGRGREEARIAAAELRTEVRGGVGGLGENLRGEIVQMREGQQLQLESFAGTLRAFEEKNESRLSHFATRMDDQYAAIRRELGEKHDLMRTEASENRQKHREEIAARLKDSHETLIGTLSSMQQAQKEQIEAFRVQLDRMIESNQQRLEAVRVTVEQGLQAIQNHNGQQLELMRATVDEKLSETLEKRLGDSFRIVSERLEQVHRGLGEMQTLASGVGDLKKVLGNVKIRGGWGEVQLEMLLEQMLAPDQYERNVRTKESSRESVEFAVKFPAGNGEGPLYLPLDSKFPLEDYQRLVDAAELGDLETVESCGKDLERRIRLCAKDIRDKYINPPATTDFAMMFLPVEGLYAEVLRRPGLGDELQRLYHVVIAGPTTLAAILSSFQMGFRTLAIEKRSSEVWNVLAAVKTEFGKFGVVLAKVKKNLDGASDRIDDVGRRSRAIERHLKNVESMPEPAAETLLDIAASSLMVEAGDDEEHDVVSTESDDPSLVDEDLVQV